MDVEWFEVEPSEDLDEGTDDVLHRKHLQGRCRTCVIYTSKHNSHLVVFKWQ